MNWNEICNTIYVISKMVEKGYEVDIIDNVLVLILENKDIIEIRDTESLLEIVCEK
jgi:hypothetical protein